jgi:hypothetical protein
VRHFTRTTAFLGILPGDPIDDVDLDHIEQSAGGSGFHNGVIVLALCAELRKAWGYAEDGIGIPVHAPHGRGLGGL